jgi:hypothetical protein
MRYGIALNAILKLRCGESSSKLQSVNFEGPIFVPLDANKLDPERTRKEALLSVGRPTNTCKTACTMLGYLTAHGSRCDGLSNGYRFDFISSANMVAHW